MRVRVHMRPLCAFSINAELSSTFAHFVIISLWLVPLLCVNLLLYYRDLYAHNIMVDRERSGPLAGSNGQRYAEVFDFGAAFFYAPTQRDIVEPLEVYMIVHPRACFAHDL